LILTVFTQSFAPLAATTDLDFTWGGLGPGGQITLHIQPADIDLQSEILRTSWFQLNIYTLDNRSFNTLILWPGGNYFPRTSYPPQSSNGTYDWRNIQRTVFWEPITPVQVAKGAEPYPWQLQPGGEYPWDQYTLSLFFGFNRTLALSGVSSGLSLSPTFSDSWKVTQTFGPIEAANLMDLMSVIVSTGNLPSYLNQYADWYNLKITFVRQTFEVLRGDFAFWIPAAFLAGLLIVAFGRIKQLKVSEALTVFLGVPLAALPFVLGAVQILPPRLNLVEVVFYLEIVFSTAFAAIALAMVKTE
jgi:hypothetical protein